MTKKSKETSPKRKASKSPDSIKSPKKTTAGKKRTAAKKKDPVPELERRIESLEDRLFVMTQSFEAIKQQVIDNSSAIETIPKPVSIVP